jgi:hypothetical protein
MRSPRLRAAALAAALAVPAFAPAARAQDPAGPVPGVPAGEATLRGRVVRAADGSGVAGVEVVLYALPAGAPPGLRRGESGADGRFVFERIDHAPDTTYLVGARYEGVSYPGARVQFAEGEREREVEVRVHEVTGETRGVAVRELRMRLDWLGDRVEISEALTVANSAERTVLIPPEARRGRTPAVELGLPAGARDLAGPLGLLPEGLVAEGGALRWFGPILPGDAMLEYRYAVPAAEGTLRFARRLPGSPLRVTVLAPAGGPALRAPGLSEGEATVVAGRGYRVLSGELSGSLAFELDVPAARRDPAAVSIAEVRIVGELDPVTFIGREEHVIQVAGETPVLADGDAPLLAIPMPEGASELRFGAPESGTRLAALPGSAGLGVLGPLAPGETVIEVRYRMPVGEGPFRLARRFAARVPLLSVYLADTGNLRVDSDRLHRRRSARTPDRSYIHLEAFELAPGEEATLSVVALPPKRALPRAGTVAFVALAAGLAAFTLAAPLRGRRSAAPETPEAETAAEVEREALELALADLEHDFETGKLDSGDYERMHHELHTRADTLRSAPLGPERGAAPGARSCAECRSQVGAEDRFCARCGARLA